MRTAKEVVLDKLIIVTNANNQISKNCQVVKIVVSSYFLSVIMMEKRSKFVTIIPIY